MLISVTVSNSGKISLQKFIIKMFFFTLAASRLNSKVDLCSLGLSQIIFASHWSQKNSKLNGNVS